ncbi:uncharacterized protein LOC129267074 [Lytechinus pictus]|uniref:uncharacterized protein LOC129267074 n=1 Tax=Lytechinus pictus TaxID=7653 RepID=UPI0030BA1F3A
MVTVNVNCVCGNLVTKWSSQPTIGRQPVGNILTAGAILLGGQSYEKMAFFASLLNLEFISRTTFNGIQESMLFPTINTFYQQEIRECREAVRGRLVTVIADGRCDSPGYNAKYCTYTCMDSATYKVIAMALVQVSQANSSVAMEKVGCKMSLDDMLAAGVEVKIFATDRHGGIRKMLREEYEWIDHQFDVWHFAKSVVKRLTNKAKTRDCQDLAPWIQHISNHIWWSSQNCREDPDMLVEMLQSMTHHLVDVHTWNSGEKFHECAHAPLTDDETEERKWLEPGSKAHEAVQQVIFDKLLVKDMKHLTKACHTGVLESYHGLYLKYCPKRQHFFYPAMLARAVDST